MKIIDTHQHLWNLHRFTYAWLDGVPQLRRSYLLEDYLRAAEGLGIVQSLHMEADVDPAFMQDETDWILGLAAAGQTLCAAVVGGRPESPDFPRDLERVAALPRVKGLRRILHTQPDELSEPPLFAENLRRLAPLGLSFDLCLLARQLPVGLRLARACPQVSFILDHCGVPRVKERELDPWRASIRELARLPNVACKVSGIVAYADPHRWTPADLAPYVEHVIECFGWDRVMFGSDWPVCTLSASLRQWVEALSELTRGAGEENRRKLFSANAQRIYRLAASESAASGRPQAGGC